ncbi:MAG TPA: hypothetical protein VN753_00190 [Terracidiphilus sp.]|jgi:hypothetical protein|nr:hypothetical protein [Terracidiphilus sp.]
MTANSFAAPAPVSRRVRAYFAPIERTTQSVAAFNPAKIGDFDLEAPPAPWIDLGWIQNFARKSASKSSSILTGIPAAALEQTRGTLEAHLAFEFLSWTKLTMALATGAQHMNLLACSASEGETPAPAIGLKDGSTSSVLQMDGEDAAGFAAGSMVAVDTDYAGQTGYVGSPVSGAYVRQPLADPDYVRRVTFNVGLVLGVSSGSLILAQPLPGGVPVASAKVQAIAGFVDREGGSFYQEWSALFVVDGSQGERIFLHYPRLQTMSGAEEMTIPLDSKHRGGLAQILLKAQFLALPVTDPLDGERVLCYRSFRPAPYSLV